MPICRLRPISPPPARQALLASVELPSVSRLCQKPSPEIPFTLMVILQKSGKRNSIAGSHLPKIFLMCITIFNDYVENVQTVRNLYSFTDQLCLVLLFVSRSPCIDFSSSDTFAKFILIFKSQLKTHPFRSHILTFAVTLFHISMSLFLPCFKLFLSTPTVLLPLLHQKNLFLIIYLLSAPNTALSLKQREGC